MHRTHNTNESHRVIESFRKIGGVNPIILGEGQAHSWQSRINNIYNWCKNNLNKTFIHADAFDTCCVRKIYEFEVDDLIFSAESNCWPDGHLAEKYPECSTRYRFLNAGLWIGTTNKYIDLVDKQKLSVGVDDDQRAFTAAFLSKFPITLDYGCKLFHNRYQSEYDCTIENGLYKVNSTGTYPIIVHGNGKSDISSIWSAFGL